MPLNNVLIKDGHTEPADDYDSLPELEAFLSSNQGDAVRLPNDVDLEIIKLRLPNIKTIIVEFPSFADGRGFSIARQLRKTYGYKALLIAEGPLIPDQYAFALQCGFDAKHLSALKRMKTLTLGIRPKWHYVKPLKLILAILLSYHLLVPTPQCCCTWCRKLIKTFPLFS